MAFGYEPLRDSWTLDVAATCTTRAHRPAAGCESRRRSRLKNHLHRNAGNPTEWSGNGNQRELSEFFPLGAAPERGELTSSNRLFKSALRKPENMNVWPHRGSFVLANVFVRRLDLSEWQGSKNIWKRRRRLMQLMWLIRDDKFMWWDVSGAYFGVWISGRSIGSRSQVCRTDNRQYQLQWTRLEAQLDLHSPANVRVNRARLREATLIASKRPLCVRQLVMGLEFLLKIKVGRAWWRY